MKSFVITAFVLAVATPAIAEKPVAGTGFTCTAPNGVTRRFNIDLKKKRYQAEGKDPRDLAGVNEAVIDLVAVNPDLMSTPMGPVFYTEQLDRRTLVLAVSRRIPQRNINETVALQCVMGPNIDFSAGRRF